MLVVPTASPVFGTDLDGVATARIAAPDIATAAYASAGPVPLARVALSTGGEEGADAAAVEAALDVAPIPDLMLDVMPVTAADVLRRDRMLRRQHSLSHPRGGQDALAAQGFEERLQALAAQGIGEVMMQHLVQERTMLRERLASHTFRKMLAVLGICILGDLAFLLIFSLPHRGEPQWYDYCSWVFTGGWWVGLRAKSVVAAS